MLDLIDQLLIDIDKLDSTLEKLKDDAKKYKIFLLANTRLAQAIVGRVYDRLNDITKIQDDKLRRQIFQTIDATDSLVNEIDSIESYLLGERNKSEAIKNELQKSLVDTKLKLLEQGYFIDQSDGYKVKRIGENQESNDPRPQIIRFILEDMVSRLSVSEENVSRLDTEYKEKRQFALVEILSTQAKLKELASNLNEAKQVTLKHSSWFNSLRAIKR